MKLLPFLLQGLLISLDEGLCHRRRTLRRWERLGHPVDSLSFLACLGFLLAAPPSAATLYVYGALAVTSCLIITKDEWEHGALCSPFENWLHALLFMVHPVLLIWAGYLWWVSDPDFRRTLGVVSVVTLGFTLYQIVYWNLWRDQQ